MSILRHVLAELWAAFWTPRVLALWAVIALILAVAGPFGTYDQLGFAARLGYWTGGAGLALIAGITSSSVVGWCCGTHPGWARHLLLAILFALILVPVQRGLTVLFHGRPIGALQAFMIIAMVPVAVAILRHFWLSGEDGAHARAPKPGPAADPTPDPTPAPPPAPRLLDRLPPELRGEILHLSVRDHYVEVLTDRGAYSLLMRFSDAMAEAEGVPGLQVHRSHWVAEAAITGGARRSGKAWLTLRGGREVPVSRGFLPDVAARGYL